jgi:peptide/nickel transport system ATP-binding protein
MYLGNVVEIGPAEDVIENPRHPYTKILRWSTADLDSGEDTEAEPPIRSIDIPDPVDPPSGCPFQTRCPKAREHCTRECPDLDPSATESDGHRVACFRECDADHPYWESDPIDADAGDADIFDPDVPPAERAEANTDPSTARGAGDD